MILTYIKKILIIPDFGTCADNPALRSVKEAVEADGTAKVLVADLRKMVLDEHQGNELRESDVIELSARKLETLAGDQNLSWGPMAEDSPEDPLFESTDPEDGLSRDILHDLLNVRSLNIHISVSDNVEKDTPDTIVVFGRSAMLADGVEGPDVLFIDPEYDDAWPWKKQYYAGRKTAERYYREKLIRRDAIETAYSFGSVISGRFDQPGRYAIFSSGEKAEENSEFFDRYPRLWMIDTSLNDNPATLSRLIGNFADRTMDIPLLKIDEMLADFPCENRLPEICRFDEPIEVEGRTVTGLKFGTPMCDGQSRLKVCVKGQDYPLPIETFRYYNHLAVLRDAVAAARKKAKEIEKSIRRIMIVPDYFSPHDNPAVLELRELLRNAGYHVTVFCPGNTLEASRRGLERICKRRRYDMIVTISTGCLLASRISSDNRIYINPDWAAWEWMEKMLGEDEVRDEERYNCDGPVSGYRIDKNEIAMARDMGARYNIRQHLDSGFSTGWFTSDEMDSHLPEEHRKRFGSATFPPRIGLDTEIGIAAIAREIDKLIKSDKE